MRLIDADRLKHDVLDWQDCYNGFSDTYDKSMIIGEIDAQPTVKTEPIRHGRWVHKEYKMANDESIGYSVCSECGHASWMDDYNYCPSCGCKMDLDEVNDED